jgi:hypothetical protein
LTDYTIMSNFAINSAINLAVKFGIVM